MSMEINHINFSHTVSMSAIPPWIFIMPRIDLHLIEEGKNCVSQYIDQKYRNSEDSKSQKTGIGFFIL